MCPWLVSSALHPHHSPPYSLYLSQTELLQFSVSHALSSLRGCAVLFVLPAMHLYLMNVYSCSPIHPFSHPPTHPVLIVTASILSCRQQKKTDITGWRRRECVEKILGGWHKCWEGCKNWLSQISKNREVWAAAGITAKITAQHVEGGDDHCHHRSTQDTSVHTFNARWHWTLVPPTTGTKSTVAPGNQMSLQSLLLPPEWILHQTNSALPELHLEARAHPLASPSLAYVPQCSCRQGGECKGLPF